MENPIEGIFIVTIITFNKVSISNGLFEALESSFDCLADLPYPKNSASPINC